MSVVSNHAIVINGNCHGKQFSTLIPASNTVNPTGDSATIALQKPTLPSDQTQNIETQPNGNNDSELYGQGGIQNGEHSLAAEAGGSDEDAPCIDIIINNVVCSFSTRCYLNLKKIATEGIHVEYRRENGVSYK